MVLASQNASSLVCARLLIVGHRQFWRVRDLEKIRALKFSAAPRLRASPTALVVFLTGGAVFAVFVSVPWTGGGRRCWEDLKRQDGDHYWVVLGASVGRSSRFCSSAGSPSERNHLRFPSCFYGRSRRKGVLSAFRATSSSLLTKSRNFSI